MADGTTGGSLRTDLAGLPRVVWVLSTGSFINNFGGFVVPFLVLYLVNRGYSAAQAAAAVSAYAAGKIIAGPLGGLLTDRFGPKATTVGSMAGSAVATAVLAVVSGVGPIMVTATVTGLAAELYRPAVSAILTAAPTRQRVQAFGMYQLGVSAGATAGPAIGGLVAEHSFIALFAADAATSLCWAVLAWRMLPGGQAGSSPAGAGQPHPRHGPLLGDRRLIRLLAVTVLVNLILFQAQTTLPLWVRHQGLPTSTYGVLLAVNSGLILALQLPATRLTGRWRPQPVIAAASVVAGAGFALTAVAHTAALLVLTVLVWSLGELVQWPVAAAYTTTLAPPGMTGRYAGARSLCYGTALLLAPVAGTALYRLDPTVLWGACAAAGLCAAAVIAPRRTRGKSDRKAGHHASTGRSPAAARCAATGWSPTSTPAAPGGTAKRRRETLRYRPAPSRSACPAPHRR